MKRAFQLMLPEWNEDDDNEDSEHDSFFDEEIVEDEYDTVISEIRPTFEDRETDCDFSNCLRTSCNVHSLQLVVHDGLKSLEVLYLYTYF